MKTGTVSKYAKQMLLLLALFGYCARSYAATAGSITLSGTEQFNSSNSMWDSGNVTVSINGYVKTVPYGQYSTPDSIASAIAALFTSDCNGPANAKSAPGGVIYVQMRDGATLSQLTANTYSSISFAAAVNSSLIQTTTTATIASTQLLQGQATAVSVQVSCNSACGSVDYRLDGGEWGTVALDASGHFSASTYFGWAPGLHNVVVKYQGNGTYMASISNPVSFTISNSTSSNPVNIYSYNLSYDSDGNVQSYNDSVNGSWSNIVYDGVNRLSSGTQVVNGTTQYMCWNYDSFGNRTAQETSSGPCSAPPPTVAYNANNQSTGLTYDPSGDVTNGDGNQYLYDADGRVCAVQYPVTTGITAMVEYLYDAEGRRVAKGTISSFSCDMTPNPNTGLPNNGFTETAGYVLGPNGEQVTEVDGQGNWIHTNVFANGDLIATYNPQGVHFHLSDWLGSRRVQTDSLGNPESNFQNLPFGEMIPQNQSLAATEQQFTGKERDTESGLDYFGARYYNSNIGRWLSPDWSDEAEPVPYAELDNPQSLNLYAYVNNNPLRTVDVDGHWHLDCKTTTSTALDPDGAILISVREHCDNVPDLGDMIKNPLLIALRGLQLHPQVANFIAKLGPNCPNQGSCVVSDVMPLGPTGGLSLELKPIAEGPELQKIIDELYRSGDTVPGGTAGAVRQELKTGAQVGGKSHTVKAIQRSRQLEKGIINGKFSGHDLELAKAILQDLRDALAGK